MAMTLYIASALGALGLFMMMPDRRGGTRTIGVLLGAMTLGGLWLTLARFAPTAKDGAGAPLPMAYGYLFSAIAILSAARVVTHAKPVYSALWFIMVVVASAGLFVLLQAQFMAIAMVIIYGGAILVTYVFVIMLAAQSGAPGHEEQSPSYDRVPREPAVAVAAGFLLLAVLLSVLFDVERIQPNPAAAATSDAHLIHGNPASGLEPVLSRRPQGDAPLHNVERVGLDLFRSHPLGLELAGVILLVALVGAIVIARTQQEEDPQPG